MENIQLQISRLRWKSADAEKVKLCEQLIKEAQRLNDEEMEYEVRCIYMQAINFNNEPEKMLACFPWLLAVYDKHPEKYDQEEILWYYKWVIDHITKFPAISKDRILSILKDMETRYTASGYGKKPVVYYTRVVNKDLGEPVLAEEAHQKWLAMTAESEMSDCTACVIDEMVDYELWKGNYELAIEKAADLLNKKYSCTEVPERTYSKVLQCYYELGQLEEGMKIYRANRRALKNGKAYLVDYGRIVTYLTLTENHVLAKNAFIKQLPYALTQKCESFIFEFYLGGLVFLSSLEARNKKTISIPSNIELNLDHVNNKYQVSDVLNFIRSEVDRIATLFNDRNGNNFYSIKIEKALQLLTHTRKVSVKVSS